MLITWPTQLTHYVTVEVEGAESMTEEEIRQVIAEEKCFDISIESPSTKEVLKTAWYDIGDSDSPIEKDGGELSKEQAEAKSSGKVLQLYYS